MVGARLGSARRLQLAAVLVVLCLGLGWGSSLALTGYLTPGSTMVTTSYNWYSDSLDLTTTYMPGFFVDGDPFAARKGYESDVRVILVPAAGILAWAARRRTALSLRLVRAATIALAATAALALSRSMTAASLVALVAAGLAASVAWPGLLERTRATLEGVLRRSAPAS